MTDSVVRYDPSSIETVADLKMVLASQYQKQIDNFFGDPQKSLRFLSSIVSDVQRNAVLLECEPITLINSYMMMAELQLMPSGVSGEAYVLPYNKGKAGKIAQFQLGYQGYITLFYRAGVQSIHADIVRENDKMTYINGVISHEVDPNKKMKDRGKAVGAYVLVTYNGQIMGKYMNAADILDHGKKFSKSFNSEFSPWKEKNDPELWMWKKTVLKQAAKLLPKNETINKAVAADNQDSIISDRLEKANNSGKALQMGNLVKLPDGKETSENKDEAANGEENAG